MDKYIEQRLEKLFKSMRKASKKMTEANAIEDVLDADRYAEVAPDELKETGTSNMLQKKNKKEKKKECDCPGGMGGGKCECPDESEEVEKAEEMVNSIMKSFRQVSEAYLRKREMQKAKVDQPFPTGEKKRMRAERKEGFQPKTKEKFTTEGDRQMPKPEGKEKLKQRLESKHGKSPSKEDLEYPSMAANEDKIAKKKKIKKKAHKINKGDGEASYKSVSKSEDKDSSEKKPLNKPIRTPNSSKKFKVYVKDPDTGNIITVRFGDSDMEIKRDDKESRKNFRARHNCDEKNDKTKAGYWSCKMWQKGKKVSSMTKKKKEDK